MRQLTPEQQARFDKLTADQEGYQVGEMVKNIPSSAVGVAKNVFQSISDPVGAFTGMTDAMAGGIYKGAEALGLPVDYGDPEVRKRQQTAEGVADMVKQRYGSWEKALQTLESDPVGFLSDLSALGGVTAKAGKIAMIPGAGIAGDLSRAVDPVNLAITAPKAAVTAASRVADPVKMYMKAAKFHPSLDTKNGFGFREKITQTALDNEIMPSMKGAEKIGDILHGFDTKIDDLIKAANDQGGAIPVEKLADYTAKLRNDISGFKWKAGKNEVKLDKIIDEYLGDMKESNITHVGVSQLQAFKKDLYKQLNYEAKRGKLENIDSRTGKEFATGARKEIEKFVPEVADINKKWGEMIDLQKPLFQSAGRIDNRDTMGIGLPIKAGAGGAAFGPPGFAAGAAQGISDIPSVKAFSAIKLNKIKKQKLFDALMIDPAFHPITQTLFQSGRITDYEEKNQ